MGYSAFAVANYFLELGRCEEKEITPLMIQKLVYIAHGYHLAFTEKYDPGNGKPLVDDEFVEAWQYGPVFPSLYHQFKRYGGNPITDFAEDTDFSYDEESGKLHLDSEIPEVDQDDQFACALLDKVWEVYKDYTGYQLSSITHKKGSPWDKTQYPNEGFKNAHIPNGEIKNYYLERIGGG